MVKIILSHCKDTLENKEADWNDLLSGWIGNHSCGTANIGKLEIINFSITHNVIKCSHCGKLIKIPKKIKTYKDLEQHLREKLTRKINLIAIEIINRSITQGICLGVPETKKSSNIYELTGKMLREFVEKNPEGKEKFTLNSGDSEKILFQYIHQFGWYVISESFCLKVQRQKVEHGESLQIQKGNTIEIGNIPFIFKV